MALTPLVESIHGPSKSNAVASNRKPAEEQKKKFIELFGTDSEFESSDNETNKNESVESLDDVLDITAESILLDESFESPAKIKQNLIITIQNEKTESADDLNKQNAIRSNESQILATVPQSSTSVHSTSLEHKPLLQGSRKQRLLDKLYSATQQTESTSKSDVTKSSSIEIKSTQFASKIQSAIHVPKTTKISSINRIQAQASKVARTFAHKHRTHSHKPTNAVVKHKSPNTIKSPTHSHTQALNHPAHATANIQPHSRTLYHPNGKLQAHALNRPAQATSSIESHAHNVKQVAHNPFRRLNTSSTRHQPYDRQTPTQAHGSKHSAQVAQSKPAADIAQHTKQKCDSSASHKTEAHVGESTHSAQNIIEQKSEEARIIPLHNKIVPNGVQLAIAVKGKQRLSKNALKKITRNLLSQM